MGNCNQTATNQNFSDRQPITTAFNPFFQANQSSQQHDILNRYHFISNYSDLFLGRCSVLKGKSDDNLYLLKEVFLDNQEQLQKRFHEYAKKRDKQIESQNILRIKETFISKTDGFFTDSHKIILILEYPLISLKKQFNNRLLNKLNFQTEEIKDILFSTIKGYATIEKSSQSNADNIRSSSNNTYVLNDKIRMAHIFFGVQSKQSSIKVVDSEILPGLSNLATFLDQGKSNKHLDIYLAPEQLQSYINDKQDGTLPNSGVFSLGLTILDLCLMNTSATIYHYNKKKIQQSQLKNLIKIAGKNHNIEIQNYLSLMLQTNAKKRPNFIDLQYKIKGKSNNSLNNQLTQLNNQLTYGNGIQLSVVKNQPEYIINDAASLRSRSGSRKGSVYSSQSQSSNRLYSSYIKKQKLVQDYELQNIHEEYTNGNQYIGQKKNSLKHGKGKYIFKDRSYYEGKWRNNMMHGKGILYYSNGKIQYKGEWKQDEPNGWGQMYPYERQGTQLIWKKYEGSVLKGQMHGQGKLFFINGSTFEGQFFGNKILGKGRLTKANQQIIEKQWSMQTIQQFNRNQIVQLPSQDVNHDK